MFKETNKALADLKIALSNMQKHIVGYAMIMGEWEPIIQMDRVDTDNSCYIVTLYPTKSCGISETHKEIPYSNIILFPEGKSLVDMMAEPLDFHSWCKQNKI